MNIANFDHLLAAALEEPNPQRLLLVFCTADPAPDGGAGLSLAPVMRKAPPPSRRWHCQALMAQANPGGGRWRRLRPGTTPQRVPRHALCPCWHTAPWWNAHPI